LKYSIELKEKHGYTSIVADDNDNLAFHYAAESTEVE
jgi:hypothetical protein